MGHQNKTPPPPDYTPIIQAQTAQAEKANKLSDEQLQWAKEQYADNKAVTDQIAAQGLDAQKQSNEAAVNDRKTFEDTYQPLEQKLAAEAKDYASPERQQEEMGKAQATVGQQFDAARAAATRNLESFGVDPTSTRGQALDVNSRIQEAAAKAGAGNQAQAATEATGRNLEMAAINVGRQYPSQIAGETALGTQAGSAAGNVKLGATSVGSQTMGTPGEYMGQATGALGAVGDLTHSSYQDQMAKYTADQQSSSGFGSLLGAGIGFAAQNPEIFGLAGGGAIPDAGVTPGGKVPAHASPSGGAAVDDVNSALTVGEFVVPKDVTSWFGEKFFQDLINKAREAKASAGAKPTVGPKPPGPATFASRPGVPASALPIG